MLMLYVYDVDTREIVATIAGENNADCEFLADALYGDSDYYGWSYTDQELVHTNQECYLSLPAVGDVVSPIGLEGEWTIKETNYQANKHDILIIAPTGEERWIAADAINYNI